MIVKNKTSFNIIAVCWHRKHGPGKAVEISPGESSEVKGPYLGEMGGGSCHILIEGEIICHEGPDDENGFHVSKGEKLDVGAEEKGLTVFHHSENHEFVYEVS